MSDDALTQNILVGGKEIQINLPVVAPPIVPSTAHISDVISASELEIVNQPVSSSSPLLGKPTVDSTTAYIALSSKMDQITESVLAGWAKSLEDQRREIEAYLKSPAYLNMLQVHSLITQIRNDSEKAVTTDIAIKGLTSAPVPATGDPVKAANTLNIVNYAASPIVLSLISDVANAKPPASITAMTSVTSTAASDADLFASKNTSKEVTIGPEHFIAASVILGAGLAAIAQTTLPIDPVSSNLQVQSKIISDAFTSIIPVQNQTSAVLAAGWFSSMWGTAMLYQTSAENLGKYKGVGSDGGNEDLNFAKTYAESLAGSLNSPQFNQLMTLTIYKSQENIPISQREDPAELITQGKIALLSSALALVAKLDVGGGKNQGWINELEFKGLINGTTNLTANDINNTASIKRMLAEQINIELSTLSKSESNQIMSNIMAYMASNPSVADLLDHHKLFSRVLPTVLNPKDYDAGTLAYKTV